MYDELSQLRQVVFDRVKARLPLEPPKNQIRRKSWETEIQTYAELVNAFSIHYRRLDSRVHAGAEYALHHRPQRPTRAHGGNRVEPGRAGRRVVSHRRGDSRRVGFTFVIGAGF